MSEDLAQAQARARAEANRANQAEAELREVTAQLKNLRGAIRFMARRYPGQVSKYASGWNSCANLLVNWLDKNEERPAVQQSRIERDVYPPSSPSLASWE